MLIAEHYRQKFKNLIKEHEETFLEHAHVLCKVFERCVTANKIETFDAVCQAILLEKFDQGTEHLSVLKDLKRAVELAEN